MYRKNEALE